MTHRLRTITLLAVRSFKVRENICIVSIKQFPESNDCSENNFEINVDFTEVKFEAQFNILRIKKNCTQNL